MRLARRLIWLGQVLLTLALTPAIAFAQTPPEAPPAPEPTPAPTPEPAPAPEPAPEAMPAPAPAPAEEAKPAASVTYDKGFTIMSGDEAFEMKVGVRGQLRLETNRLESADELESHFAIPRLRLQLEGHAFGPTNLYKVEFDMANRGFSLLKDYFYEHAFAEAFRFRLGQWKRPFNRQEMVSDFGSEFLERSIANEFAGGGRDLGVAVHNNYEKSPMIEWAAGLFNSTGEKSSQTVTCLPPAMPADPPTCTVNTPTNVPRDFGPMFVARLGYNYGGIKGYSEGDLEGGPLRLALAASYKLNFRDFEEDAMGDKLFEHAFEIDTMIKVMGLGVSGAFYVVKKGAEDTMFGFYGQAGYMIIPKTFLLAGRFAQIDDEANEGEQKQEILGGVDWFIDHSHNYKWMLDGGVLRSTAADTNDLQFRTQIQFVF